MVYTLPQLKRLRLIVFAAVVLGISGSVTLNVLHAPHNIIAQVISGFPPVALAVSMELISRIPSSNQWLSVGRVVASLSIGGIGGSISYIAQMDTVRHYGIEGWQSDVWPIIIDGLLVVILLSLVELVRKIHQVTGGLATRTITKADREFESKAAAFREAQAKTQYAIAPAFSDNRRMSENLGESRRISEKIS